jgi:hypothetical protein
MNFARVTGTAAILFLGAMAPVYAQRGGHEEKQGEKTTRRAAW